MAKEICPNCATKMSEPVSFCPTCERPTRHAGEAELLEWDLKQWRNHVDRSVATGAIPAAEGVRSAGSIMGVAERVEVPVIRLQGTKRRLPRMKREPKTSVSTRSEEPDLVIDLDHDDAFAYRACATCHATDWIVRTRRNDDETWNYWCVRCSRAFKTEVKLRNAVKPFLSAGIVVGGIAATSILMLH
jgi:hypothetical protein